MYSIKKFNLEENKTVWNLFIKNNSEGHFFFETDYLFYHKERFNDFSLMIYDKKKELICVLPACLGVVGKSLVETMAEIISHQGLTFGVFIFKDNLSFLEKRKAFFSCLDFLKKNKFTDLIIKPLPSYFQLDNQKDDSIHRLLNDNLIESKILRVEANSMIFLPKNEIDYQEINYQNYSTRKKRNLKKAYQSNLKIEETELATDFWQIIEENLKLRHNLLPVHSVDEIQLLKDRFPKNIYFFVVKDIENHSEILACSVIFIYQSTIHLQYMAATKNGKQLNALDFLIDKLIKNYSIYFQNIDKNEFTYLSLGISELRNNAENSINEGLFKWKEEFGANTFSHFVYQIDIPS
ncbi:hypothetical protein Fleli_0703 [Bernardetia litoralis DSM 6794]|uniref:BioF2-like acetyltransferase domain-containing protein n=1 Tax=Bernardetia litoralis (strain ATCC 23117 / DSM 6794 / NBRC 15988 / NCIMB 1366 / Fx l1 / Sio-4) TaxID=880071 RepID=I4AGS9_BERLS|nr:hypothetical protein [Bernardetia litoralis]AFM03164.1 hypothetical protein Fleli_0703 [Bernardetia litoralis DSM 6794]